MRPGNAAHVASLRFMSPRLASASVATFAPLAHKLAYKEAHLIWLVSLRIEQKLERFARMVELWWSLVGAAIPAVIAGQVIWVKRRHAEERNIMNAGVREKSSNETFVCEKVCTSKRMMKKVGAFSKDPIPDTCVTVCGISAVDVCTDACARAVCVNQHQVPNWNDICLRRCQSECLKLSSSSHS
ncbi:hypothetical protein Taro_022225 [Colocasia esculenta]|uniref:Uncharacterized protein n=1 Tax=Colocasia esculenta TaxID=4460 RepID=A0A843V0W3_COLES|nr:hypothetical protein [Colocasia esculenta]